MTRFLFSLLLMLVLLTGCNIPTQPAAPANPTTANTQPPAPALPTEAGNPTLPAAEPTQTPETQQNNATWIAYTGTDGNIWLVDPANGILKPITEDAVPLQAGNEAVSYCCAKWSWDGQLLAYARRLDQPVASGYEYVHSLWVYDVASGESRVVLDNQQVAGFSWKPLTHLISYGLPIDPGYFSARGVIDTTKIRGIWAVNVDNGEVSELIQPERGFSLVNPQWSPSGQFVSFEEVFLMEGRGKFAYYNLEERIYEAWDTSIGGYQWSPDNQSLVYDNLTYIPSGEERIFLNNRAGTAEQQISPEGLAGIAFSPALSPKGDQVAYFQQPVIDSETLLLVVQNIQAGTQRELGRFVNGSNLSWSADGQSLVLSSGPYENRQVVLVSPVDGSIRVLASGSEPSWQITER